ncbi:MAG: replication protein, partial [Desulfovibrionales bacterium]|nr:replication protein [Desulfovibrionales bacterium]
MYQDSLTGGTTSSNFTQIPNQLIDQLSKAGLSGQQSQIILAIIRKTFGFHKDSDWISFTQLAKMTGIKHVRAVRRTVKSLENIGILEVDRANKQAPKYKVSDKFYGGDSGVPMRGDNGVPQGGTVMSPTKEIVQKKENTTGSSCCSHSENLKKKEITADELEFI